MTKQIGSEDWFDTHVVVLSDKAGVHESKGVLHRKIKDMVYEKARQEAFKEWVWVTLEEKCEEIRSQEQLESYVYNEYDKALLDVFTAKFIKETCGHAFEVHSDRMMDFMNDQRDTD